MPKYSYRDADSEVLKGWGYSDTNAPGDLIKEEAEDFMLQPGAWQWNGDAWVAYTTAPFPDVASFMGTLQASMTIMEANDFYAKYPLFLPMLTAGSWDNISTIVITAHTRTDIDDTLYNIVRNAAIAHNIPITLPAL